MIRRSALVLALLLALFLVPPGETPAQEPVRVVYHLTEGLEQASTAIRNIHNHLNADPAARIVVVANGKGIDFLLESAKDPNRNFYADLVETLQQRGVEFRVCRITLTSRGIPESRVIPEVSIVESGVAEAARLQTAQRHAYLKP